MQNTKDILIEGIKKSILNAEDLYSDAQLLHINNRRERAYTLYQLSIEESGKAMTLESFLLMDNFEDVNNFKKIFRTITDHIIKTKRAIGIDYLIYNSYRDVLEDEIWKKYLKASLDDIENIKIINDLKNYSLYTSYVNGTFKLPNELIDNHNLEIIEFRAITRLRV